MIKPAVRWMIKRNVAALNAGRVEPALAMFAKRATLSFPGANSWSAQFRPPTLGRTAAPTHQGRDEIEAFLRRYVGHRIQMQVEDILVNGPPWALRMAIRARVWATGPDGRDLYDNRAVLMVETRWGTIRHQEDYEDTERAAAFDRLLGEPPVRTASRDQAPGDRSADHRRLAPQP